ncbi:hypothetical protein [Acinetobacter equi]|uniref:CHAP domain-containing protein n=1 Tax=Acinetobacter equi TaxID=1324350 RepID=A0A0N7GXD2_9GAMM|nr:hypothetical protein [Acinetobacter equi]ALH94387.1 hypothetical protein AOY20_01855 [Acinetobacter equi]
MVGDVNYTDYQNVSAPAIHLTIRNDKNANNPSQKSKLKKAKTTESLEKSAPFSSRSAIDIKKFTQYLNGINTYVSSQMCARSIRIALQSAGAKIENHPVAAADWGNTLTKIGYKKISPEFSHPKQGDIYIIQRTDRHIYGHIAGFSGTQWVSDFKQRSHNVYKDVTVKYEYYRLASLKN